MIEEILHCPYIRYNGVLCQVSLSEIIFECCYHITLIYNEYSNNINSDYILQVINLHPKTLRVNKVCSAIPRLDKKLFKAIEVPIPPYNEQQRIINAINVAFKYLKQ